ncbi:exocyst complex component 7-like [Dorcoceras hygrometricum]|uniref:Exocyst complex component 7-like n=1 Tax=Dorcoceras hygrometricum TaxID=472368 RepID=A0A2Z7B2A8_9LAMI|nr:exocyst complex component 7-like [Dorcoceras hygrometricum]
MSTLKAVKAAQLVPHSFNLPQQSSRKHGRAQPTQTSFLLASLIMVEAVLNLKYKANESCRSLGFHLAKKIEQHCYFAIFSKVELQPQMGSNRKSKSQRAQRHQKSFKTTAGIDRNLGKKCSGEQ